MRAFIRRLLDRIAQKVDRTSAGTAVPAGIDPDEPRGPTARERTLMRRRLRALRREQAAEGARDAEVEREAQAIEAALRERTTVDELLASGVSARCPGCGELLGARERRCPSCGSQLAQPHESEHHSAPPRHASPLVTGASSGRSPTPPAR